MRPCRAPAASTSAAVDQNVTAEPAVLTAGRAVWPHADDEPVTRTITYRNSGPEAVTLSLDVDATGPDGDAPEGMFDLGADTVTVPAGGEAVVDVTVDTSVPGPDGRYSAWVSASAGETLVTTPVAVDREVESYDLTVQVLDREGQTPLEWSTAVVGLGSVLYQLRGTTNDFFSMLTGSTGSLDGRTASQVGPAVADDVMTSAFQGTWTTTTPTPGDGGDPRRSGRVYELAWFAHGRMFTGLTEHVRDDQLARGRTPRRDRPGHRAPAPAHRPPQHRRGRVAGELEVIADPEVEFLTEAVFEGEFRRLRPGDTGSETWNPAVFGPLVSGVWRQTDAAGRSQRR